MNRRELLKRGFEIGAMGLLIPVIEPIRRYWSLDRTMVHRGHRMAYFTENGYRGIVYTLPAVNSENATLEFGQGSQGGSIGRHPSDWFEATAIDSEHWTLIPLESKAFLRMYNFSRD